MWIRRSLADWTGGKRPLAQRRTTKRTQELLSSTSAKRPGRCAWLQGPQRRNEPRHDRIGAMLEQAVSPASWHSDPTAGHRPVRQPEDLHARAGGNRRRQLEPQLGAGPAGRSGSGPRLASHAARRPPDEAPKPGAPGSRRLFAIEKDAYGILLMKEPRANVNLKRGRRLIQRLS